MKRHTTKHSQTFSLDWSKNLVAVPVAALPQVHLTSWIPKVQKKKKNTYILICVWLNENVQQESSSEMALLIAIFLETKYPNLVFWPFFIFLFIFFLFFCSYTTLYYMIPF
jgi:hypothetical protein